jgi:hypothetical protein
MREEFTRLSAESRPYRLLTDRLDVLHPGRPCARLDDLPDRLPLWILVQGRRMLS